MEKENIKETLSLFTQSKKDIKQKYRYILFFSFSITWNLYI